MNAAAREQCERWFKSTREKGAAIVVPRVWGVCAKLASKWSRISALQNSSASLCFFAGKATYARVQHTHTHKGNENTSDMRSVRV